MLLLFSIKSLKNLCFQLSTAKYTTTAVQTSKPQSRDYTLMKLTLNWVQYMAAKFLMKLPKYLKMFYAVFQIQFKFALLSLIFKIN